MAYAYCRPALGAPTGVSQPHTLKEQALLGDGHSAVVGERSPGLTEAAPSGRPRVTWYAAWGGVYATTNATHGISSLLTTHPPTLSVSRGLNYLLLGVLSTTGPWRLPDPLGLAAFRLSACHLYARVMRASSSDPSVLRRY